MSPRPRVSRRPPGPAPSTLIRLPRRFFEDHRERMLPTPAVVKKNRRHIWVSRDAPELDELLNDAEYHASEARHFDPPMPGLAESAWSTVRAIWRARGEL